MPLSKSNLYSPSAVAVIGASRDKEKIGTVILQNIINSGYKGRLFPVNPNANKILGLRSYKSVLDISEKVDLAIIAIPARFVLEAVNDCGMKGVKHAVIISAGFAEIGDAGFALEEEVKQAANRFGIKVTGPNCLGFINTHLPIDATFTQTSAKKGSIAYVSQSGAMGTAFLDWSARNGIGLGYFVSIGNKISINENTLLEEFSNDSNVSTILMYLEDFRDGREFIRQANKLKGIKPIIILKPGISEGAKKAMASHTGSIAGDDLIIDQALNDSGCIRVKTIESLFNITKLISWQPLPSGKNTAVITNAGGVGIQTVDDLVNNGLNVVPFSTALQKKLEKILPEEASTQNPVDLLGDALAERYRSVLEIVAKDKEIDNIVVVLTPQRVTESLLTAKYINEIADKNKKTVVATFLGGESIKEAVDFLNKAEIPHFAFPNDAAEALGKVYNWTKHKKIDKVNIKKNNLTKINPNLVSEDPQGMIPLSVSQQLFKDYGIPILESRFYNSKKELLLDSKNLPYPLVVKLSHAALIHKTELKAVRLNIKNDYELEAQVRQLQGIIDSNRLDGTLYEVQPFIADKLEVIIGVKNDGGITKTIKGKKYLKGHGFGHILLFGAGGIYAELYKDAALRILPINRKIAKDLITSTKIGRIIEGYRGKKYDIDTTIEILLSLSKLVKENSNIQQLDINPLFISPDGIYAADIKIFV